MRILILNTYEQPTFLLGDSSYLLTNQFVQIAAHSTNAHGARDVFLYWVLPEAATDDGDTGGYLKIPDPNLPQERDLSEVYMPEWLGRLFSPVHGQYPIDVILTNNAGKAAALANWFNLNAAGRARFPVFIWDYSTKFRGGTELGIQVNENLAVHALGYGLAHNMFFSEYSRQAAYQDVLAYGSAALVKNFLDRSRLFPVAIHSARMEDALAGVTKAEKFSCYWGGRFTATKGGEKVLDEFDLLYAFGRDIAIKVTTPTLNASRLTDFLETRGQEIEVYERLSQRDAWRVMAQCHVSVFWQSLKMFPAAPFEQLYAGLVVLFRDCGYEREILPPNYPFVFQTKEEAGAMLRWVYENYAEAKAKIAWVPQWIREHYDAVTLVPQMLDWMREAVDAADMEAGLGTYPQTGSKSLYELTEKCLYDGVSFTQFVEIMKQQAHDPGTLFGNRKGRPRLPFSVLYKKYIVNAGYTDTCETPDPIFVPMESIMQAALA